MNKPSTEKIVISGGCAAECRSYARERFGDAYAVVCDGNTEPIARRAFPGDELIVFQAGSHATEQAADGCISRIKSDELRGLIACGSGSVHDIARYSAHDRKIPFVSFPTAASVDGFASGVAAMTWHGRKVTFPSAPPIALFADDDVYSSAPRELLASGVGDIVGKYVSIFDWIFASLLTDETVEDDIYKLENESLETVMHCDISSPDYPHGVMDCLVKSGIAIQLKGSSRPASGAEHHLSHLWEMGCIGTPRHAYHGEQVGVSALFVLDRYKRNPRPQLRPKPLDRELLRPIFGTLTDGIIEENTPDSLAEITQSALDANADRIAELIKALPDSEEIRGYLLSVGAKTTLTELGLPDSTEFIQRSLDWAPYVRRRLTYLKVI